MFHVDNNSAVPVMPAVKPVVSAVTSFFTEGGNGVPPTYPGPDWFNIIQSELLAVLAAAGITPDKASNVQLLAAMRALFLDTSQNGADIQDKALFLKNLGLGTAAKKDIGTGAGQVPDMSSFTSTLNTPGVMRFPGRFTVMWALGSTGATGVANITLPASFQNACLGAIATERNPYAWGAGQTSTFAVQIDVLTKNSVQALGRQISGGTVSAVANVGCLVLAWGY